MRNVRNQIEQELLGAVNINVVITKTASISIISIVQVKTDSHLEADYISIRFFEASCVATQEI